MYVTSMKLPGSVDGRKPEGESPPQAGMEIHSIFLHNQVTLEIEVLVIETPKGLPVDPFIEAILVQWVNLKNFYELMFFAAFDASGRMVLTRKALQLYAEKEQAKDAAVLRAALSSAPDAV